VPPSWRCLQDLHAGALDGMQRALRGLGDFSYSTLYVVAGRIAARYGQHGSALLAPA
jgi:sulfite reductase alpha subunit-like flavoprotein